MSIDEKEVYITENGRGRASIVERDDGFFCIYVHWIWFQSEKMVFHVELGGRTTWHGDKTPLEQLYHDIEPKQGLYQTLDDARREIRGLSGFSDAALRAMIP